MAAKTIDSENDDIKKLCERLLYWAERAQTPSGSIYPRICSAPSMS
jgi:hypothetical protein